MKVVKIFGIPESTIRDACERHDLDLYREDRAPIVTAFKAASPDVKSKANVVVTMRLNAIIKLAKRLNGVDEDVLQVGVSLGSWS